MWPKNGAWSCSQSQWLVLRQGMCLSIRASQLEYPKCERLFQAQAHAELIFLLPTPTKIITIRPCAAQECRTRTVSDEEGTWKGGCRAKAVSDTVRTLET